MKVCGQNLAKSKIAWEIIVEGVDVDQSKYSQSPLSDRKTRIGKVNEKKDVAGNGFFVQATKNTNAESTRQTRRPGASQKKKRKKRWWCITKSPEHEVKAINPGAKSFEGRQEGVKQGKRVERKSDRMWFLESIDLASSLCVTNHWPAYQLWRKDVVK